MPVPPWKTRAVRRWPRGPRAFRRARLLPVARRGPPAASRVRWAFPGQLTKESPRQRRPRLDQLAIRHDQQLAKFLKDALALRWPQEDVVVHRERRLARAVDHGLVAALSVERVVGEAGRRFPARLP